MELNNKSLLREKNYQNDDCYFKNRTEEYFDKKLSKKMSKFLSKHVIDCDICKNELLSHKKKEADFLSMIPVKKVSLLVKNDFETQVDFFVKKNSFSFFIEFILGDKIHQFLYKKAILLLKKKNEISYYIFSIIFVALLVKLVVQ